MAYIYPFRMTSTTATMVCIDPVAEEVIVGVRSDNAWVFPGADSMPGGFMEARWSKDHEDGFLAKLTEILAGACRSVLDWTIGDHADRYHDGENSVDCAVRELKEEFNIVVDPSQVKLFDVRANPRTDTRAHVTNVCYYIELTPKQVADLKAGDDIQAIKRIKIADLFLELPYQVLEAQYPMAFNHFELMMGGVMAWQKERRILDLEGEVIALRIENKRLQDRVTDQGWELDAAHGRNQWGA